MLDSSVLGFFSASPQPLPNLDDFYNSPGTIGFITTFLVAGIAILLFFDMNKRIRRTKFRQEIRARLATEELEAEIAKPERPAPPERPNRPASPESEPS